MVDTVRSLSALQTTLADNITGDISPQDIRDMLVSTYVGESQVNLENGKTTSDTPDDDFNSGTLDGKWTVVDGSSGTVDLLATSTTGVYDLATRPNSMLLQAEENSEVAFRQDYELPDGNSIVMACGFTYNAKDSPGASSTRIAMTLNDNDTSPTSGNYERFGTQIFSNDIFMSVWDGSNGFEHRRNIALDEFYLRITRAGLDYSFLWSYIGDLWTPLGTRTASSAYTNIWIGSYDLTNTTQNPVPIQAIHWIRQGSNTLDPW